MATKHANTQRGRKKKGPFPIAGQNAQMYRRDQQNGRWGEGGGAVRRRKEKRARGREGRRETQKDLSFSPSSSPLSLLHSLFFQRDS